MSSATSDDNSKFPIAEEPASQTTVLNSGSVSGNENQLERKSPFAASAGSDLATTTSESMSPLSFEQLTTRIGGHFSGAKKDFSAWQKPKITFVVKYLLLGLGWLLFCLLCHFVCVQAIYWIVRFNEPDMQHLELFHVALLYCAVYLFLLFCWNASLSLRELKTIRRLLDVRRKNLSRFHLILGSLFAALIFVFQYLKKPGHDLHNQTLDAMTGVAASVVAAAAYNIFDSWKTLREKFAGRTRLLALLGISEEQFDRQPLEFRKVRIVLPLFSPRSEDRLPDDCSSEDRLPDDFIGPRMQTSGPRTEPVGAAGRSKMAKKIGLYEDITAHSHFHVAEDVRAFQTITQMFQDRDIPWEIVSSRELAQSLNITDDMEDVEQYRKAIAKMRGPYVVIGLYSNHLSMLISTIAKADDERMYVASDERDPAGDEIRRIAPYFTQKEQRAPNGTTRKFVDYGFLSRRFPSEKASIFIIGGLTAKSTKALAENFAHNWDNVIAEKVEGRIREEIGRFRSPYLQVGFDYVVHFENQGNNDPLKPVPNLDHILIRGADSH
jgi:hypothetical protein